MDTWNNLGELGNSWNNLGELSKHLFDYQNVSPNAIREIILLSFNKGRVIDDLESLVTG